MHETAASLLDALGEGQRRQATAPFDAEELRRDWHYVPRSRPGLALGEMTVEQQKLAFRLLASALSDHAFAQAAAIVALEDVLDEVEGGGRARHRNDYAVLVFGEPDGAGPWGWRFEGHHLSVNVTMVGGEALAMTPLFLGANPATVAGPAGPVLRPLGPEEDLARELARGMAGGLRSRAVIADEAPSDILTTNRPRLDGSVQPDGVAASALGGGDVDRLRRLVGLYLSRLPPRRAGGLGERVEREWGDLHFGWAGSLEPGRPHYYRVQGPSLLVEYDNTQNGANHIHTVLRDAANDFGDDVISRHRREVDHGS